jgi:hypothetical protein
MDPNAPQFVPKRFENFYFHVTKEEHLPSIRSKGLQPTFGGSAGGMSYLRLSAQAAFENLSQAFVDESKNKVHLTRNWDAVIRYSNHSLLLTKKLFPNPVPPEKCPDTDISYDEIPMGKLPVILRCQLWGDVFLGLARTEGRRRSGKTKTSASRGDTKRCMSVRNRLD